MWSTIGRGQDPPPGLQSIASLTKGIYSRVLKAFEQVLHLLHLCSSVACPMRPSMLYRSCLVAT